MMIVQMIKISDFLIKVITSAFILQTSTRSTTCFTTITMIDFCCNEIFDRTVGSVYECIKREDGITSFAKVRFNEKAIVIYTCLLFM